MFFWDTLYDTVTVLSGMCSQEASCTIAEARSLGSTALIIAHELAHNLGVEHDGSGSNQDCDPDNFIMGPKLSPGATSWSQCSKRQLSNFVSRYGDCLHDSAQGREEAGEEAGEWEHGSGGALPGERFDGDDQCHLMYGGDWTLYNRGIVNGEPVNVCRAIWCRKLNSLRSPNAAALQVQFFYFFLYFSSQGCFIKQECDHDYL